VCIHSYGYRAGVCLVSDHSWIEDTLTPFRLTYSSLTCILISADELLTSIAPNWRSFDVELWSLMTTRWINTTTTIATANNNNNEKNEWRWVGRLGVPVYSLSDSYSCWSLMHRHWHNWTRWWWTARVKMTVRWALRIAIDDTSLCGNSTSKRSHQ